MHTLIQTFLRLTLAGALVFGMAASAAAQDAVATNAEIYEAVVAELQSRDLSPEELTAEQAESILSVLVAQFGEEDVAAITDVLVRISPNPSVAALFVSAAVQVAPARAAEIAAVVPAEVAAALPAGALAVAEVVSAPEVPAAGRAPVLPFATVDLVQDAGQVVSPANAD